MSVSLSTHLSRFPPSHLVLCFFYFPLLWHIGTGRVLLPQSLMVFYVIFHFSFPFLQFWQRRGEFSLLRVPIQAGTPQIPQTLQIARALQTQAVPKHSEPAGPLAVGTPSLK